MCSSTKNRPRESKGANLTRCEQCSNFGTKKCTSDCKHYAKKPIAIPDKK